MKVRFSRITETLKVKRKIDKTTQIKQKDEKKTSAYRK